MADFSPPLLQKPSQNTLEMEGVKKLPSLPSNYVTLQQLQEKRLKEQQQQKQKEEKEKEEEERKKYLDLDKSLQTLEIKASNRPSRKHRENRPKIVEKRGETSVIEKEINDQGEIIEESKRKQWKKKMKGNERNARKSRPENGQKDEVPKKIDSKNREDRTVEIDQEIVRKESDERSTAEKKVNYRRSRGKIQSKDQNLEDRTVEIARKIGDLSVEGTDGDKERDKTAEKKPHQKRRRKNLSTRKKDRKDRTVENAQKKGDIGAVDCDQTVEESVCREEVDQRSTAVNQRDLWRLREKFPVNRVENVEKDRADRTVEIAQKIGEVMVVDCDENVEMAVGGEEVGEISMAKKKFGYQRSRGGRGFGNQRDGLWRLREKFPAKRVENIEKDSAERKGEIAQKIGEVMVVDCDENVEMAVGGEEVGEISMAKKKFGYQRSRGGRGFGNQRDGLWRLREKFPAKRVENIEKDSAERTVEIAQKIGEVMVVDCDENVEMAVGGEEVGEISMARKRFGYQRSRGGRGFGYHQERRKSRDSVWVRKEENSQDITHHI